MPSKAAFANLSVAIVVVENIFAENIFKSLVYVNLDFWKTA